MHTYARKRAEAHVHPHAGALIDPCLGRPSPAVLHAGRAAGKTFPAPACAGVPGCQGLPGLLATWPERAGKSSRHGIEGRSAFFEAAWMGRANGEHGKAGHGAMDEQS